MTKRPNNKVSIPESFDSGLVFLEPVVYMPAELQSKLKAIQEAVGECEFSALGRLKVVNNRLELDTALYIPKQEVDTTSVDYCESMLELQKLGWNTVFHSHPFSYGVSRFSATDEDTINAHFPFSVLLNRNAEVVDSSLTVYIEGHPMKIQVKVQLFIPSVHVDITNIKKKRFAPSWYGLYNNKHFLDWEDRDE